MTELGIYCLSSARSLGPIEWAPRPAGTIPTALRSRGPFPAHFVDWAPQNRAAATRRLAPDEGRGAPGRSGSRPTPTWPSSGSTRTSRCRRRSPPRPAPPRAKGGFKKLTAVCTRARPRTPRRRPRQARGGRRRAPARRRRAGGQGGGAARGELARLGAAGDRRRRRRRGSAGDRHDPRRLPLRPLQGQPTATTRRRRARVADAAGARRVAAAAEAARVYAEAQNRARDLQSTPANFATPSFLAARAEEIAAGARRGQRSRSSAARRSPPRAWAASPRSARAASEDPRLIVLRYAGGGSGPTLGLVGKGVTFDTGGISLKPGAGMQEMKFDMSGGAGGAGGGGGDRRAGPGRSTSSRSSPRPRTCPPARRSSPAT